MYAKKCEGCGSEFETQYKFQKYCCKECGRKASNERCKKWRENAKNGSVDCKAAAEKLRSERAEMCRHGMSYGAYVAKLYTERMAVNGN